MSNRSDGGRDRTGWKVSTIFKPIKEDKAQASDSLWVNIIGLLTRVVRSVVVMGVKKVQTFTNVHVNVWGNTYALITPAQVSIWVATKGLIMPEVVYATKTADDVRFLSEKFVFFVVEPSSTKGMFDVRYLRFKTQTEQLVAVKALGFWSNMDWKRSVRLKVNKYIGSWLSPCESIMVKPRGETEWFLFRCDGSISKLHGDVKVVREVDPTGANQGLIELVRSLDKIVNIVSGLGMRRTKTRAEFGEGYDKGMSLVVKDNVDWDIRIHDKTKSNFFKMGSIEFISFGHEAESGKLFHSDITTVTLSNTANEQMLKEFRDLKDEALNVAVGMTEADDYLSKIFDLTAGGVSKMATIVKFLGQYMTVKGVEAVSGATVNLMMAGLNPFLVPWATERALLWADGHFSTILRKLRLPMNNAIRVYPVVYLADSMGEYTAPTPGNPTLEKSKDGCIVCLIHPSDWADIFKVSGGPDQDDSWGWLFFRVGGKLKGFWARQPFGPGDGWFTGNLTISEETLKEFGIRPQSEVAYMELKETTDLIRNDVGNVSHYEEMLKHAGFVVRSMKAERTVESVDKVTKGALALLRTHGRNLKDTKLEVGKKADHLLTEEDSGVTIGPFTNVAIIARVNIGNAALSATEKMASMLFCTLVFFHQLVEPVVDKLAGLDEKMEKLYQLASNCYWYFLKNNRVIDYGFMSRLPMVSVEGKIFGWKRLLVSRSGSIAWPMEADEETHKLSFTMRSEVQKLYHQKGMFDHDRANGSVKHLSYAGQAELLRIFGYKVTHSPTSQLRQGIHDMFSYSRLEAFGVSASFQKKFLRDLLAEIGDVDALGNNTVLDMFMGLFPVHILEAVADTLNVWGTDHPDMESRYQETFEIISERIGNKEEKEIILFYMALQLAQMLRVRVDRRAISDNERGRSEKPIFKCFLHEFIHGSEKSPGLNEGIEALGQLKDNVDPSEYNRVAHSIVNGGVILTAWGESTLDSILFTGGPCLIPKGSKDPFDEDGARLTDYLIAGKSCEQWSAEGFREIVTLMQGGKA